MNYREVNSIRIEGNLIEGDELEDYCRLQLETPYLASWKDSVYNFLLEWLEETPYLNTVTSGSTGLPRSIRIDKQHMINSALMTGKFLDLIENDKALLCLPADYIAGKMMLVRSMVLRLDLFLTEPSKNPLENQSSGFDFAAMVPLQVFEILKREKGKEEIKRINKLIIGGGPVSKGLRKDISGLQNQCFSTYGMTETVSHIAMEHLNGPEADGLYHLLPGIRITTDDKQRLVLDAPDITEKVVHTNDIVELQTESSFRVLGRYDNMIISGGVNVIPELVEKKLEPLIPKRFIVSSLPDEKLGEKVILVIEDKPWSGEDMDILKGKFPSRLEKFQVPKDIVFKKSFKETKTTKIDRTAIRDFLIGL